MSGLRQVVGVDLAGARGATSDDQAKIDRTVVRLCASRVWTKEACDAHTRSGGLDT